MSVSIINGTNAKPAASAELAQFFASRKEWEGQLLIGYPIIGVAEGRQTIDAVWLSHRHGILIFDLVEGADATGFDDRQDDLANKIEARLKTHRDLMSRRKLLVPINTVSFAPGVHDSERYSVPGYQLAIDQESLKKAIEHFEWSDSDERLYKIAVSAVQSISTIRSSKAKRATLKGDSRGAKLKKLEDSIATLDNRQGRAVLETVDGVQRIRGLAGSGKTVVLALKAAYLHAQHPEWKIAVTFNTRSLKGQFRRLINNFSVEQAGEEPDWDMLKIVNAWGAPGDVDRDGIYHEFCKANGTEYYDLRSARIAFGREREFSAVCEKALNEVQNPISLFDVILVDEAQDFPPAFLRLCYESLCDPKRLVYAYDELQNLSSESVGPPEDIFGCYSDNSPRVSFEANLPYGPAQDIILSKCYRNSRPILVTAHALGFGIYRPAPKSKELGLVQMFDQPQLWEEIGYRRGSGELRDGQEVSLYRPEETSPAFLENHSPVDDLIQFHSFSSEAEQAEWMANEIVKNLAVDELRADDIVVINPNPLTTRDHVGLIRARLLDFEILSHIAGVDTDPDVFYRTETESITFTGIYRAKGNEAAMVYIIHADECNASAWNLATLRNRLFTAITRSKAWVRVLGIGKEMQSLIKEFDAVKRADFELNFRYPSSEQRKKLKIVHRDVSSNERKRLEVRQRAFLDWLAEIESGNLHYEDLDEETKKKLAALSGKMA